MIYITNNRYYLLGLPKLPDKFSVIVKRKQTYIVHLQPGNRADNFDVVTNPAAAKALIVNYTRGRHYFWHLLDGSDKLIMNPLNVGRVPTVFY